jgi:hypothetical protein
MVVSYQDLRTPRVTATWLGLLERGLNPSRLDRSDVRNESVEAQKSAKNRYLHLHTEDSERSHECDSRCGHVNLLSVHWRCGEANLAGF